MAPRNIDDPAQLNDFLKAIGGEQIREAAIVDHANASSKNDSNVEIPISDSASASAVASPSHGVRAPPSTPATRPVAAATVAHLEPVPEDEAGISLNGSEAHFANSKLEASRWAKPNPSSHASCGAARIALTSKSANTPTKANSIPHVSMTSTQLASLAELKELNEGKNLGDIRLAKFRVHNTLQMDTSMASHQSDTVQNPSFDGKQVQGSGSPVPTSPSTVFETDIAPGVESQTGEANGTVAELSNKPSQVATPFEFMPFKSAIVKTPATKMSPYCVSKEDDTNDSVELEQAREKLMNKVSNLSVTEYDEDEKVTISGDTEQHREGMTHFSSWGTPPPRDKPKSRIRKVILTGLPPKADYTLVQSLIHGGSIETLSLYGPTKSTTTSIAYVTFANANAADAYYEKYPNGLDFKFQGKKYTTVVGKGKDVDVMSSLMEGYLECGGSRVIRVTDVDDDWGMRALYKIAEGKGRQVENIIDTYRNEVSLKHDQIFSVKQLTVSWARTIVFRFTGIREAVQFKSQLVRDIDWEHCDIHFMADPCETAKGVHLE